MVKGMVVESEALKAQNCALSKFSLPMHSNGSFCPTYVFTSQNGHCFSCDIFGTIVYVKPE